MLIESYIKQCSSYRVASTSFGSTSRRKIQTERLDLPPALISEDAGTLCEVSHSGNPDWSDAEALLGCARVDKYTVVVPGC